jgi:hypothetical protein
MGRALERGGAGRERTRITSVTTMRTTALVWVDADMDMEVEVVEVEVENTGTTAM